MEVMFTDSRRHRTGILERAEYLLMMKQSHVSSSHSASLPSYNEGVLLSPCRYEGLNPLPYKRHSNGRRKEQDAPEEDTINSKPKEKDRVTVDKQVRCIKGCRINNMHRIDKSRLIYLQQPLVLSALSILLCV